MKLKVFLLLFSIALCSCSKNDNIPKIVPLDLSVMEYPQKWQLFKMSGGMAAGSETTGNDMMYQEYYILNADNTFTKTRVQDRTEITVRGSYSIESENDEQAFRLIFNEDNSLIGNCSMEPVEYLYLRPDRETLLSNWWACDGPGLFYKHIASQT